MSEMDSWDGVWLTEGVGLASLEVQCREIETGQNGM